MGPLALLLIIAGLAAAGGGGGTTTPGGGGSTRPSGGGSTGEAITWFPGRGAPLTSAQRDANYAAVRKMGQALEAAGIMGPGFGDWLRVVAYSEARGNPAAGGDTFANIDQGMFQMVPTTAWNETPTVDGKTRVWDENSAQLAFHNGAVTAGEVAALKDLPWAVALAAHTVNRLRKYTAGTPYTRLGARRGWKLPGLVADHDNSEHPEILTRNGGWNDALAYFGIPASFGGELMDVRISQGNFPSVHELHDIITAAVAGESPSDPDDGTDQDQAGFVAGTIETDWYGGASGNEYAWALGQRDAGPWTWSVDVFAVGAIEAYDRFEGDVDTRAIAAKNITTTIQSLEA